jgi:hypothetical protein
MTVGAGDRLLVKVGAQDRQSGVVEVIARCRARDKTDLASSGHWNPRMTASHAVENYYPVVIPIPASSPTVVWELYEITLRDGEGNSRTYRSGTDFEELLFKVQGRSGIDCTPPRLLGIRLGRC